MQPKLKRAELDRVAGHYGLDAQGVDALLDLAHARPGERARRNFLASLLSIGGLLSLAAGVVFFVAANWSEIAVFGRFALLEVLLLACTGLALFKPPPAMLGRATLFLAFVTTGTLLALFGQTYQTGADVYELFLTWALLGLPLVLLSNWSVSSAAWLLVLNTSLMLFCGGGPSGGWLFLLLSGSGLMTVDFIIGAACVNLVLWLVFELRPIGALPQWVRRVVISCAFLFATTAGLIIIGDHHASFLRVLVLLAATLGVVAWSWTRRSDIYPLAVVLASLGVVSVAWLVEVLKLRDEGMLLVLAAWIIAVSTAGGRILVVTSRHWRAEEVT